MTSPSLATLEIHSTDLYLTRGHPFAEWDLLRREALGRAGRARPKRGPRSPSPDPPPALERLDPTVDGKLVNETARRLLSSG
jgi:hypothetical protein